MNVFDEQVKAARVWWDGRTAREHVMLGALGGVLALVLAWFLILAPLLAWKAGAADRVQGPFWGGRVIGARAGVMPLGDLKVSVNPFGLMLAGDDAARLRSVTVRDASGERIPLDGFAAYRPSGP